MRSRSASRASGVKMCDEVRALVLAELAQRPERVRHRPGREQQHLAVGRGDRVAERPAGTQEVLGVTGLAHADADPLLVRQAPAQVVPEVHGGVEDRQVRVVDRRDPGAVLLGRCRHGVRELRVPGKS
jgi:hypothetical protein